MNAYFGTDGVRAPVGQYPVTYTGARILGEAIGKWCVTHQIGQVVLAGDNRPSGSRLLVGLAEGLRGCGIEPAYIGVVSTPVLVFALREAAYRAVGVMVTASHNSVADNGFKCFAPDGCKADMAMEQFLEQYLAAHAPEGKLTSQDALSCGLDFLKRLPARHDGPVRAYVDKRRAQYVALMENWSDRRPWVIDLANGAVNTLFSAIFQPTPVPVICIGDDPNGERINDQCGAVHPAALQQAVVNHGAAFGAAFDGDGDRLILVNDKGEVLNGDTALYLLASAAFARGEVLRDAVGTVMTNEGLVQALAEKNVTFHRTPVGDRWILEKLKGLPGAWLGGESSGHIIQLQHLPTGDALLNLLCCMDWLSQTSCNWETALRGYTPYAQRTAQIVWPREWRGKPWQAYCSSEALVQIKRIVAELESAGRCVIRLSGTEPCLRIMVECRNEQIAENSLNDLCAILSGAVVRSCANAG